MQLRTPTVQQETGSQGAVEQPAPRSEPFIDVTGAPLYGGLAVFVIVFVSLLVIIIRGRVIGPARRRAEAAGPIFEPAGEGAEITFDEPEEEFTAPQDKKPQKAKKKEKKKRDDLPAHADAPSDAAPRAETVSEPPEPQKQSKAAPFSNLFSKKKSDRGKAKLTADETGADHSSEGIQKSRNDGDLKLEDIEYAPKPPDTEEIERQRLLKEEEEEREELRRQAEERAALDRQEAERAAAEKAAQARRDVEERERSLRTAREAEFERRKAEAALEQRMQSVTAMQRKLAERTENYKGDAEAVQTRIDATLEKRFAEFSDTIGAKLDAAIQSGKNGGSSVEIATFVRKEIAGLRASANQDISALSARIDEIKASQEDVSALSQQLAKLNANLSQKSSMARTGRIMLPDLLAGALPADKVAMEQTLNSGRRIDCLISLPNLSAPVAVEADYPVDAYDAYARSGLSAGGEAFADYRSAILEKIVDTAEQLIAPPETADFAILYAPSEAIFADLHANFADLVRDSMRARIWILSPTSFMATLQMMSAVNDMSAASGKKENEDRIDKALASLERRLEALEEAAKSSTLADLSPEEDFYAEKISQGLSFLSETTKGGQAKQPPHEPEDAAAAEPRAEGEEREQEETGSPDEERPPFPLS